MENTKKHRKKVLNITNLQENANQNHHEIPAHTQQDDHSQ